MRAMAAGRELLPVVPGLRGKNSQSSRGKRILHTEFDGVIRGGLLEVIQFDTECLTAM